MAWKCRSVNKMILHSATSSRGITLLGSGCYCSGVQGSDRLHYNTPSSTSFLL